MSMTRGAGIVLLAAMVLAGCESAPADKARPETATPPASGAQKVVEGSFADGPFVLPLPPGRWQVAYSTEEKVSFGKAWRHVLVKTEGRFIKQAVFIYRTEIGGRQAYEQREACGYEGYFHSVVADGGKGSGECWHVRTVSLGLIGTPNPVSEVFRVLAEKFDLVAPLTMVGTRYIRFKAQDQLQVDYVWTPELLVPPPVRGQVWKPEDWSNEAVRRDANKLIAMKTLQRWGEAWYPKIEQAFPL
jgi:hypothetical protein